MSLYISESEIPQNDLIKIVETSFHNKFNFPVASSCTKKGNKVSSNNSNTGKGDIFGSPLPSFILLETQIYKITNNVDDCLKDRVDRQKLLVSKNFGEASLLRLRIIQTRRLSSQNCSMDQQWHLRCFYIVCIDMFSLWKIIVFAWVIIYNIFSYDTGSCVKHRWRTLSVLPG